MNEKKISFLHSMTFFFFFNVGLLLGHLKEELKLTLHNYLHSKWC